MAQLNLVNAAPGRRLAAKALDTVPVLLLWTVFTLQLNTALAGVAGSPGNAPDIVGAGAGLVELTYEAARWSVFAGLAGLAALAYWVVLWGWEARTGNSPGNAALGIRTTGMDGFAPGWGAVFIRNLVIGTCSLVPLAGFVLVMVSSAWDAQRRQGWHDRAARTLVFDVRSGRNPLATGGVRGPESFAPPPPPPAVRPVPSPLAVPAAVGMPSRPAPEPPSRTQPEPPSRTEPEPPAALSAQRPWVLVPEVDSADGWHPDDDAGATRVTHRTSGPGVRIVFDTGRELTLRSQALIGRNPAGQDGEMIDQLIDFADEGRSVSKTHLHLRVEGDHLWVTDRNSTNGSAVTSPDGQRTAIDAGQTLQALPGSTVHFGDRSFLVGRP
jgi:uncharacterized RDD family membrane protein YckC